MLRVRSYASRWVTCLALVVTAASCIATEEDAVGVATLPILEAVPTTDYANIGMVTKAEWVDQLQHCTGTLIGDRTVLTARHCLISDSETDRPNNPEDLFFEVCTDGTCEMHLVDRVAVPPHDPENYINDLGLIRLAIAPAGVEPRPLCSKPPERTTSLRVVGYGIRNSPTGEKAYSDALVADVMAARLKLGDPATGSSYCFGDSGAPALHLEEDECITSTVSGPTETSGACTGQALAIRVDPQSDPPDINRGMTSWIRCIMRLQFGDPQCDGSKSMCECTPGEQVVD